MASLKTRLYKLALGRSGYVQEIQVSCSELLYYLWKRGGRAFLRGALMRYRFQRCGGRLFMGKKLDILFPKYISLGRNVYLGDYSYLNGLSREGMKIGNNVRIREHVWIQASSSLANLGKGLIIEDNTYIGPRCCLGAGGGIHIGSNVTIGAAVDFLAENHNFSDADIPINEQGVSSKGIRIEDDVWIGNRVIVLDGVRISRGAVVGAGAVVTKDVTPYTIAVGNPARPIGTRKSKKNVSEVTAFTQQSSDEHRK